MNVLTFPGSMSICYQNKKYKSFIGRKELELSPFSPVFRRPPGSLKKEFPICSSKMWGWLCSCTCTADNSRHRPKQHLFTHKEKELSLKLHLILDPTSWHWVGSGGKSTLPTKSPQHLCAFLPSCSCKKQRAEKKISCNWLMYRLPSKP